MKYSVLYSTLANYQLTDIWLRAKDKRKVTDAVNALEKRLRYDAHQLGVLDPDGRRVLVAVPLAITFDVIPDDCNVVILSMRYNTSPGKS